jgi:RNase P/RNase MRP subunit POP5
VKVSLALIHQIGDSKVIFQTTRVSGTIKAGKGKIDKSILKSKNR